MLDAIASGTTTMQRWLGSSDYDGITGRKNALHLIQLRWIAVLGQITTIAFVNLALQIPTPTAAMLGFVIFLIAFNLASALRWHESESVSRTELLVALLVDVFTLTAQLYLSGGTQNPFAFLYLMQIVISAVLLDSAATACIILITSGCLCGLSRFSMPLQLPSGIVAAELYTAGMVICFMLNATLSTVFITRIIRNLRARQAQVAEMRQHAAEEDHIVRMGLLASGAAHELGTPLATLSVILGDWQRMPAFGKDRELAADLSEMQAQLNRCKGIISGILLAAGEVRSESSSKTTICQFLDDLVEEWQGAQKVTLFEFENRIADNFPIAFQSALKQMLCNVLDNAAEVSPLRIRLSAECAPDSLHIEVADTGPGFAEAVMNQLGRPYQSTKPGAGRGLGLFFVVNVARKLGGTLQVRNLPKDNPSGLTGAAVSISLPLTAIRIASGLEENNDV